MAEEEKKVEGTQTTDKEKSALLCDVRTRHFRKYQTGVLVLVLEQSLVQSDFHRSSTQTVHLHQLPHVADTFLGETVHF